MWWQSGVRSCNMPGLQGLNVGIVNCGSSVDGGNRSTREKHQPTQSHWQLSLNSRHTHTQLPKGTTFVKFLFSFLQHVNTGYTIKAIPIVNTGDVNKCGIYNINTMSSHKYLTIIYIVYQILLLYPLYNICISLENRNSWCQFLH